MFSTPHLEEGKKKTHPQDKIQHLDFTKDPRPLYYKTPPCVFYQLVRPFLEDRNLLKLRSLDSSCPFS